MQPLSRTRCPLSSFGLPFSRSPSLSNPLPPFRSLISQTLGDLASRLSVWVLEHVKPEDEEEEEPIIKNLKDLNFETCTSSRTHPCQARLGGTQEHLLSLALTRIRAR